MAIPVARLAPSQSQPQCPIVRLVRSVFCGRGPFVSILFWIGRVTSTVQRGLQGLFMAWASIFILSEMYGRPTAKLAALMAPPRYFWLASRSDSVAVILSTAVSSNLCLAVAAGFHFSMSCSSYLEFRRQVGLKLLELSSRSDQQEVVAMAQAPQLRTSK